MYNTSESLIKEVTDTVFRTLMNEKVQNRMRPVMAAAEEIISAAEAVEAIDPSDLKALSPMLHWFPQSSGVKALGYRLGDISYLTALETNPSARPGDRPSYSPGCLWYTQYGFCFTPDNSFKAMKITDLNKAMDRGLIYCSSPTGPSGVKQFWAQRISEEYLPTNLKREDNNVAFDADWAISKADIFTLNIYAVAAKVYSAAAEKSISHVDWINYRLCALTETLNFPEDDEAEETFNVIKGTTAEGEELYLFLRRFLYPQDLSCIQRLTSTGEAFDFDEYAMATPPMDQLMTQILYKHINAAIKAPSKKRAERPDVKQKVMEAEGKTTRAKDKDSDWEKRKAQVKPEEESRWTWGAFKKKFNIGVKEVDYTEEQAKLAKEIKHLLLLRDSLAAYCGANLERDKQAATLHDKIKEFFDLLGDKEDFQVVEKLFDGAAEIRNTNEFKQLAEEKLKYYIELENSVPKSLNRWLEDHTDVGAIIDAVSAEDKYSQLVDDLMEEFEY